MKNIKIYTFFLIFFLFLFLPNIIFASPKLEKVQLVLNWLTNGSHTAYYLAKKKGYYADKGLDVEIMDGSGSGNAVKVVGSGSQDFGIASGESIAMGRSAGVPIVVIAVFYQKSPVCIFSLKNRRILKPSDLEGKTVGVKFGSSTHPMYLAMLKKYNIDRSKLTEISIGKGVQPLLVGDIDAMNGHIDNEPIQIRSLGYDINTILYHDLGIKTYGISLITNEALIIKNPNMVKRFVGATLKGWLDVIKSPREAVKVIIKKKPMLKLNTLMAQAEESLQLLASQDSLKHGLGWQTLSGWEMTVSTLKEMGLIKNTFDVNLMFSNKFLRQNEKVDFISVR